MRAVVASEGERVDSRSERVEGLDVTVVINVHNRLDKVLFRFSRLDFTRNELHSVASLLEVNPHPWLLQAELERVFGKEVPRFGQGFCGSSLA